MQSRRPPRFNLQALLGLGLLAAVVGGLSWLVLSIGPESKPQDPVVSGTAIAAPTDVAQLPDTPTATPRALPTRESAQLPQPSPTAVPTRSLPTATPAATEPAVQVEEIAKLPASGPTPTPRVIKADPTAPAPTPTVVTVAVAATVPPSTTTGIAQEVTPVAPAAPVESAQVYPTPAPLVDAPPPTATPVPTFAPEVAQQAPAGPRPMPTIAPEGTSDSGTVGTSDGGAFFPNMPDTMPTIVVPRPNVPDLGQGDVAQQVPIDNGGQDGNGIPNVDVPVFVPGDQAAEAGQPANVPGQNPRPNRPARPNNVPKVPDPPQANVPVNPPVQQVEVPVNRPTVNTIRGNDNGNNNRPGNNGNGNNKKKKKN